MITVHMCRDLSRVQDGLGERLGVLLQWLATLVAGIIVSMVTEWRLTMLMAVAGLLIAVSTAVLSVVSLLLQTLFDWIWENPTFCIFHQNWDFAACTCTLYMYYIEHLECLNYKCAKYEQLQFTISELRSFL